MWLSDTVRDKAWLKMTCINNNGLRITQIPRESRKGGGLALITRTQILIKSVKQININLIEAMLVALEYKKVNLSLLLVYRPPYNKNQHQTAIKSTDDILDALANTIPNEKNLILLGDFNIPVNMDQPGVQEFLDGMQAIGLTQMVSFHTHNAGNVLDLIFVQDAIRENILHIHPGDFLSDHRLVHMMIRITKVNFTQ